MNILITGAFGFVGNNLSKTLKTVLKHHLIAIDINEPTNHIFDKYYSWDDLKKVDWSSVDTIIHLAGKAHDTKNTTDEKSYFDINTGLTEKIFDLFIQSDATKFIFFSSVKAVADTVTGNELTEEETPKPQTPYGKSKLEAEKYILGELKRWSDTSTIPRYRDRLLSVTETKKVFILRPSMIHGPGNKGNLNLLFKIVSKGIPWPLGAFENNRSFTSIDNLAFIINEIIEKDIKPGIYNVSDDESLSTNEIIRLIAASQNGNPKILKLPVGLIKLAAKIGDIIYLPINSERLKKLTESYVVSNIKLKQALGIAKMPFSAEKGMKKTLSSF